MCRSLALTGRELQIVPVAMTDLCRACEEAEPPRARESFWTQGGQPGTDAVLARWWGRSWGSPARRLLQWRQPDFCNQVRISGLSLGSLSLLLDASRCPEGHCLPSPIQVGTVGCGASAPEECKCPTCISLGVQAP